MAIKCLLDTGTNMRILTVGILDLRKFTIGMQDFMFIELAVDLLLRFGTGGII